MKILTVSDETHNKIKDQVLEEENKIKEKSEVKIEINNRWTGSVIYSSKKETMREAVVKAVEKGANLKGADFYKALFYGKGGNVKINKDQVEDFLTALGIVITN